MSRKVAIAGTMAERRGALVGTLAASTREPAAVGIGRLRDRLAQASPAFADAVRTEGEIEAACRALRRALRAARLAAGVDQAELARRMDVSQSAVSKLESGTGDIGLKTVMRYAAALGQTASVSLSGGQTDAEEAFDAAEAERVLDALIVDMLQAAAGEARARLAALPRTGETDGTLARLSKRAAVRARRVTGAAAPDPTDTATESD